MIVPIYKNLLKKMKKGTYDSEKALKAFENLTYEGARKYIKEYGSPGQKVDVMFNKNTRRAAAVEFRDFFEGEVEVGGITQDDFNNPARPKHVAFGKEGADKRWGKTKATTPKKKAKKNPDRSNVRSGACPSCQANVVVPVGQSSGSCSGCGESLIVG